MDNKKTVELEEGWNHMAVSEAPCVLASIFAKLSLTTKSNDVQTGITKLKRLLEGEDETSFNAEQYMMLYT